MRTVLALCVMCAAVLSLGGCGHIVTRAERTPTPAPVLTKPAVTYRGTPTPKPATPVPTPTFTPSPTPIIHVVRKGDTLLGIAIQYGVSVQALQEANGILDPRRLQLGQELIVPQDDASLLGGPPTPTPTPVAYAIENVGFYYTSLGSLWFLGEVHNTTAQYIEQVQVLVTLQTEDYTDLARSTAFAALDFIGPGARSPFAVLFQNPPDKFSRYQVIALAGVTTTHLGRMYKDVKVVRYFGQSQGETLVIVGEVENTGADSAEAITVVATGYDSDNKVVAIRAVDLPLTTLSPGGKAPFRINLLSSGGPVTSYTVQVQAYRVT